MQANLLPQDVRGSVSYYFGGVTVAPITKYVATTGNDTTGKGTVALPYATVDRAYQDMPRVIAHECKILVTAGDYATGWPESIAPTFIKEGSLAIVGVGVPRHVSGPWSVTGVADLGLGGQRLTIGAGGLGAVDGLCGQMVMIATGGHVGNGHMVVGNSDTTIDLILQTDKPHNADTFNLVNPAVKIVVPKAYIGYENHGVHSGNSWTPISSRLILHNIWLDFTASPTMVEALRLAGIAGGNQGVTLDFVRIDCANPSYGAIHVDSLQINYPVQYSSDYVADGGTAIANIGADYKPGLTITSTDDRAARLVYLYGSRVSFSNICVKGWVLCGYLSYASFGFFGVGILSSGRSKISTGTGIVVGKAGSPAIDSGYDGSNDLNTTHILLGSCALRLYIDAKAWCTDLTCDIVGVTGSAVDVGEHSSLILTGAHANFVGATGARAAYRFTAPAVDINGAAWPAVGAGVTDAMGSFINRRS
jgi:hypothetical protein